MSSIRINKGCEDHGVGARQIGRQVMITTKETLIPSPARQKHTPGGHPKVKQLAAAPNPDVEIPPAAPIQAAQDAGPA